MRLSIDEALERGLISEGDAREMRAKAGETPGNAANRDVGSERHPQRKLYRLLCAHFDPNPVWELSPGPEVKRQFRIDMGFPAEKVAIELDGFEAHRRLKAFKRDRERSNVLQSHGWAILHFTAGQVAKEPEQILAMVDRLLTMRRLGPE